MIYNDETHTITLELTNFSYSGAGHVAGGHNAVIWYEAPSGGSGENLVISLSSVNTLVNNDAAYNSGCGYGIYYSGDKALTINGAGSLAVSFVDSKTAREKRDGIFMNALAVYNYSDVDILLSWLSSASNNVVSVHNFEATVAVSGRSTFETNPEGPAVAFYLADVTSNDSMPTVTAEYDDYSANGGNDQALDWVMQADGKYKLQDTNGKAVALNGTYYPSLEAALTAAADITGDAIVTLLTDIQAPQPSQEFTTFAISSGNVILDLNGKRVNAAGDTASDVPMFTVNAGGKLTVTDSSSTGNGGVTPYNGDNSVAFKVDGGTLVIVGGSHGRSAGGDDDNRILKVEGGNASIAGGRFVTTEVNLSNYVAPGYQLVDEGTGGYHYYVQKIPDVAQIGQTRYHSLAEAVAAAQAGNTIDMLKSSEET